MMGLLGAQRFTLMAKLAGGSRLEETKAEKAQLDAESAAKRSRRLRVQRRRLRSGRGGGQSATAEVSAVAEPEQSITTRELLIGRLGLFDTKADLIAFDVQETEEEGGGTADGFNLTRANVSRAEEGNGGGEEEAFNLAGALDGLQDVDMYTINEPDSVLRYTLADSVCSLGLILVVLVSLHVILILIWPVCVNRAYYMQVRKTTRLLPAASATFIAKRMRAAGRVMPFPGSTSDSSVSDGSHPGSQPARIADNNACVNARADVQPSIASADKLSCPCANHEPPEAPAEVANGSGDGAEPGSQPQAWTGPTGHERWKDTDKQIVDESCSLPPSPPSSPQPHMGNGIQPLPCAPARSGTEVTGRSRTEAPQPLDPTT